MDWALIGIRSQPFGLVSIICKNSFHGHMSKCGGTVFLPAICCSSFHGTFYAVSRKLYSYVVNVLLPKWSKWGWLPTVHSTSEIWTFHKLESYENQTKMFRTQSKQHVFLVRVDFISKWFGAKILLPPCKITN